MSVTAGIPCGHTCPACGGSCQERDCQAAACANLSMPNPRHTHTVLSLDGGLTQTGWCGMFVYVPWFDRDVSRCCKAKPRPGLYTGSVQFGAADGGSDEAQMTRIQQCSHKSRVPKWCSLNKRTMHTAASFLLRSLELRSSPQNSSDEMRLGIYRQK